MDNLTFTVAPRNYKSMLHRFLMTAPVVEVSGQETHEILNGTLLLKNPRDRLVMDPARKMNPGFAVAEWYSLMTGENDINFFKRFIHDYDRFSSDGKTLDGCYGERVTLNMGMDRSQVEGVIAELRRDHTSRRAVISIYNGSTDLFGGGGKNTPCTETIQFLLRDERLDCVVNMRSFDLIKGFTYDAYIFTMLQEYVSQQLGVKLGSYYHNAGSMHVYSYDIPMIRSLGDAPRWPFVMEAMPPITKADLVWWHNAVRRIFEKPEEMLSILHTPRYSSSDVHGYLNTQSAVMLSFAFRKTNPDLSLLAHDMVHSLSLKRLLRPWLVSAGIKDSRRRL